MIDLHTHSLLSDGVLLPSELVRRAAVLGARAVAITDHADQSNLEVILPQMARLAAELTMPGGIKVIPGVELTYVPPDLISDMAKKARQLGARLVLVHGETVVEPVIPGTNRAALEAAVDILAHPGLITEEEVRLAKKAGVYLELTARRGHSLTNGRVARLAFIHNVPLLVNSDAHDVGDLLTPQLARAVALGAGLTEAQYQLLQEQTLALLNHLLAVDPAI